MRRWRFIKEKTKQRLPTYAGEAITSIIGVQRSQEEGGVQPESSIPGKDVTTSDRNKTHTAYINYPGKDVTTSDRNKTHTAYISYTTGVA